MVPAAVCGFKLVFLCLGIGRWELVVYPIAGQDGGLWRLARIYYIYSVRRSAHTGFRLALSVCAPQRTGTGGVARAGARARPRGARAPTRDRPAPRAGERRRERAKPRNPLLPRPPRESDAKGRTRTRARARQGGGAAHSPSAACFDVLINLTLHSLTAVSLEREREKGVEREHPGELDVRGRSDFSRFDPRPKRPHFSNFGPPAAPTLATLLAAWIEDLFAEAPVGAGWGPRRTFSTPGAKATDFSRFGAHLLPEHLSRFVPKIPPTLATKVVPPGDCNHNRMVLRHSVRVFSLTLLPVCTFAVTVIRLT